MSLFDQEQFDRIVREESAAELKAMAAELEREAKTVLRANDSINTGLLVGTLAAWTPFGEVGESIRFGTPVEYGRYVEEGTLPHWPPIEPIKSWVEQKIQPHVLAVGVSFETGRAVPTRKGTRRLRGDRRQRAVASVAYAIARKISREGTKARPFLSKALENLGLQYQRRDDGADLIYDVDVTDWLLRRGSHLWERIIARMKG